MRLTQRLLFALPLAAALLTTSATSYANTISGSVYENQPAYPASLTAPTTPADATFKVTGLMFDTGENGHPYTIGGFLRSFGDLVAGSVTMKSTGFSLSDTMDNTTFQFIGTSYFVNGETYSITHDDGVIFSIAGTNYINSPSPTASDVSSFIYTGTTGVQSFNLLYAEVNGKPGILETSIGATPEPSTLLMLSTGLASIGGAIRRKLKA